MKKKIIPVLALCALTVMPANAGICPMKTLCLAVFGIGEIFMAAAPPEYQRPVRIVQVTAVGVLGTLITWQYIKPYMPWSECPTKDDNGEDKTNG